MTARTALLRAIQASIDLAVLSIAIWLGYAIRFDWTIPRPMLRSALFFWPYVAGLEFVMLVSFGVPRYVWRYVGLREVSRIFLATSVATVLLVVARTVVGVFAPELLRYALLPYGVIAINFTLAFLGIAGVRSLRRTISERVRATSRRHSDTPSIRTLLIGAGQGGLLVAKEIENRPDLGIAPVGFVDDDPNKLGTLVHGIPVIGKLDAVARLAPERQAQQALITISNAQGATIRRVSQLCAEANLDVKIIPGVHELVGGRVNLSRIRDVLIEDLLRRDPVQLDEGAVAAEIEGRTVVVTGAGGSIGSELCRQACRFRPARLLLVERAENALFEIHRALRKDFPDSEIVPCIADVSDSIRIRNLLERYRPQILLHAAAHKHVPMMEMNPVEAIKNNVLGTKNLADLAEQCAVERFVMVSTDKAVRPSSVMGASKRAAEMYIQAKSHTSSTRFVTVRFGNVLGSAGSVVPIFQRQIASGGPVTVTHPDMRRYFMTIPEASQLVLQAGTMGNGGEIFILDMGDPVRIVDLAQDLIRLSGFTDNEIGIEFTGVRPGEKLYEELSTAEEHADRTRHPSIFVGKTASVTMDVLEPGIERLRQLAAEESDEEVRAALGRIVPDFSGASAHSSGLFPQALAPAGPGVAGPGSSAPRSAVVASPAVRSLTSEPALDASNVPARP